MLPVFVCFFLGCGTTSRWSSSFHPHPPCLSVYLSPLSLCLSIPPSPPSHPPLPHLPFTTFSPWLFGAQWCHSIRHWGRGGEREGWVGEWRDFHLHRGCFGSPYTAHCPHPTFMITTGHRSYWVSEDFQSPEGLKDMLAQTDNDCQSTISYVSWQIWILRLKDSQTNEQARRQRESQNQRSGQHWHKSHTFTPVYPTGPLFVYVSKE